MRIIKNILKKFYQWNKLISSESNAHEITLNPITLSFKGEQENKFLKKYYAESVNQISLALVSGAIFYLAYFFLDIFLAPEFAFQFILGRLTVSFLLVTTSIIIIKKTNNKSISQPLVTLIVLSSATALIYFQILADPLLNSSYYVGLIVIYLWSYSFLKLRFIWASFLGLTIFIFYELTVIFILDISFQLFVISTSFLLGSNFVGMFVSYLMEFYARKNFHKDLILEESRNANQNLSEKINESDKAITQAEAKLILQSHALESAANSIIILTYEGNILWCNNSFSILSGYTKEEVLGKNPRILRSGKHDDLFYENLWETILEGKVWSGELVNKKKNGDLYYEEMTITPVSDEDSKTVTHFIAIKQDITLRKDMEKELFESERRLRSLFENVTMGIYRSKLNGEILMGNDALIKMLGFDSVKDLQKNHLSSKAGYVEADNRKEFINKVEEAGNIIGFESEWRKKDGSIIVIRESARLDHDENGETIFEGTIEDITLSKLAEKDIEESRERLQTVFDNLYDAVILHDQNGNIVQVNSKVLDLYNISMEEAINSTMDNLSAPGNPSEKIKTYWQEVFINDKTFQFEWKAKRPTDNYEFDVEIFLSRLNLGNEIYILANIRDITERKEKEQALRMTKYTVDNSAISIFWHTKDAKFLFANSLACQILGYSHEEILSMRISDIDPIWDEASWEKDGLVTLRENKVRSFETIFRAKSGSLFPVEIVSNLFNFEGEEVFVVYATDITERKEANRKLLINQKAIDLHSSPIFWITKNGQIIYANTATSEKLEFSTKEFEKMTVTDIDPIWTDNYWKENVFPLLEEKGVARFESTHKSKKGFEFPVEINASIINYEGEDYVVAIATDITDRINTAKNLIDAKEKAEQSNKLKTEFLAGMSHEIRTPINTILNFISLIKSDLGENTTDDIKDSFEMIESGSRRLTRTIDSIINMSQLQAGSYDINEELLSIIDDVLTKLHLEFKQVADQNNLEFDLIIKTEETNVLADQYTITQLFINLIDNALKYTTTGKVSIVIKSNSDFIIVEIIDTGVGMSESFLPTLFNPFVQEEMGYSRSFDGNGLGLALVSKYLELNNGKINVQSEKGVGSTFTVKLPKPTKQQLELHSVKLNKVV